jgi:trimeric autotransporter adhesin
MHRLSIAFALPALLLVSVICAAQNTNTSYGYEACPNITTGSGNSCYGYLAGYNTTTGGDVLSGANNSNVFVGWEAGYSNTTKSSGTYVGAYAGFSSTAANNTFVGNQAGEGNSTGGSNTFTGAFAGQYNNGSNNVFVGYAAGENNGTGSTDIYIGNQGSGSESNTTRIGSSQTAAYIAGIYGKTSSSGIAVYINSNGQLGTQTSSLRFKEQVRDMGDSSDALMKLRPVTFFYKPEYDDGQRTLQYGLIAEEVAKVYPDLVAYDQDGQPYAVRYQYLTTMLLNEVQKQHRQAEAQAAQIAAQQQEIESLKQRLQVQHAALQQRLSQLEALAPVEVATTEK